MKQVESSSSFAARTTLCAPGITLGAEEEYHVIGFPYSDKLTDWRPHTISVSDDQMRDQ